MRQPMCATPRRYVSGASDGLAPSAQDGRYGLGASEAISA